MTKKFHRNHRIQFCLPTSKYRQKLISVVISFIQNRKCVFINFLIHSSASSFEQFSWNYSTHGDLYWRFISILLKLGSWTKCYGSNVFMLHKFPKRSYMNVQLFNEVIFPPVCITVVPNTQRGNHWLFSSFSSSVWWL